MRICDYMLNLIIMKNTRLLIMELIETYPGLTSEEISQKLNLTQAGIRYHLSHLLKTGAIHTPGVKIDGRGRPTRIFHISNKTNDLGLNNLTGIILNLLNTFKLEDPMKLVASFFPLPDFSNLPASTRLRISMQILENYHYRPAWEATREGPKVSLQRCPYSAILQNHPELCHMDQFLINRLTGLEFYQSEKIDLVTSNPAGCVFLRKLN
ncbi:MAG: winged helix-turn-helix transcriptional regulator [Anaerolineaceae bacterium]|nr:winged helix-turn-helix transcriptional regulator [Anaerolineaceae bacterium]